MGRYVDRLDSGYIADVLSTGEDRIHVKVKVNWAVAEIGRQGRLRICW